MFKKREWSKYDHVMFVEDFRGGIKTYEILRKVDKLTGESKYKRIYVKCCVHSLSDKLKSWWQEKIKSRCCGRCDGINDICVTDTTCEPHKTLGCRICWPEPEEISP